VVTDINYPPYLFQTDDGELQGILKDKWALWSRRTGIPARLEGMEWSKAQESVQNETADVIEALAYTEARTKLYEYSPAYAPIEARVFFHRTIAGINDVASMRGFSIGAKGGSACADWLAGRGIDAIRAYASSEALVKAAGTGEVRLFCMDSPAARYFLFKHDLAEEFRETPALYSTEFHWAVKKGRSELRDFIQSGFGQITTKELEDIDARWLGVPLRFQIGERYLYYFALLGAAVVGFSVLLLVWNRALRSRVSAKTAELQQSEERFQRIFINSPYPIVISRLDDLKIVEANEAALTLFGFSREEVIGKTTLDLNAWEKAEQQARFRQLLAAQRELRDMEARLRDKSGDSKDMLLSAQVIELKGEELAITTLVDITERKRAERLLEESETRLAKIIEASPEAITIVSLEDGAFLAVNPAGEQLCGYRREEMIGKTALELGLWPDPEARQRIVADVRRDGVVRARAMSLRHKGGEPLELLASAALIENDGRQMMLYQAIDVTERRRAERLLEQSEERLRATLDNTPGVAVQWFDRAGRILYWNPASERLYGIPAAEAVGRGFTDIGVHTAAQNREFLDFIASIERSGSPYGPEELKIRARSGAEVTVLYTMFMIPGMGGGHTFVCMDVDITGRKHAEIVLQKQEELLRELAAHHDLVREAERAHIAREVHDELGQALTALKMELSLVSMKFGVAAPQIREPVQELKGRVDDIIQTVRDVATALRPAALDFGILPGVEWLVEEFQKRSGIRCTVSVAGGDIVLGEDRSIVLFRILQESLTNIARHAKASRVEILFDHDAERVRLDVQDDGIGFDMEAARSTKTFGLLGMRERAIMLRGEMSITSAPGRGTRVSVVMTIE